jgi:hypothetical protein
MRVPYDEGIASHIGPESCVGDREGAGEALTGESAGRVLSRESNFLRGADGVTLRGRQHGPSRQREGWIGPAWSKTPRMHGNALPGNREIPRSPQGNGLGDAS